MGSLEPVIREFNFRGDLNDLIKELKEHFRINGFDIISQTETSITAKSSSSNLSQLVGGVTPGKKSFPLRYIIRGTDDHTGQMFLRVEIHDETGFGINLSKGKLKNYMKDQMSKLEDFLDQSNNFIRSQRNINTSQVNRNVQPSRQNNLRTPPPPREGDQNPNVRGSDQSFEEKKSFKSKAEIEKEVDELKEREKMIDTRAIESALEDDERAEAQDLLEELKENYEEYQETISKLEDLDKKKSSLAEKLADDKIDRDTFNDARKDIEHKKADLEQKLNRLRKEVIHEDYEKPF